MEESKILNIIPTLNGNCDVDIKDHFRIWFSNHPDVFLPPFEKVIIEESIKSNPSCITTLIVDKNSLSIKTCEQLVEWGKNASCTILDINDIPQKNDHDLIILAVVKKEIEKWRTPPYSGNPGIASDLARLLISNKGIYFDCDIYTCKELPVKLNTPQGFFVDVVKLKPEVVFNNDIMTFSSPTGREFLEKYKLDVLNKYFNNCIPSKNLSDRIDDILKERAEALQDLKIEEKNDFIFQLVAELTGINSLNDFINSLDRKFKVLNHEIINYMEWLQINAKAQFFDSIEIETNAQLAWLPCNNINTQSDIAYRYLDLFRQKLIEMNIGTNRILMEWYID